MEYTPHSRDETAEPWVPDEAIRAKVNFFQDSFLVAHGDARQG